MRVRLSSVWYRLDSGPRRRAFAAGAAVALALGAGVYLSNRAQASDGLKTEVAPKAHDSNTLELSDTQLKLVRFGAISERAFPLQREAVGSIDFNEDMTTQVFPPYQGRIMQLFAKLGDNVTRGQPLFTLQSPDLIQAESSLIAAAGVLDLTSKALERAKQLREVQGIADKDLEQAVSDQQTAAGALEAARSGVTVFGKSVAEIDRMVQTRTIDPYLVVLSPVNGRVTARNAAPGVFVQPGNTPAPYSVADISRIWLNASVTESDMPVVQKGQPILVSVMAFPNRTFEGRISTVGSTVDPQLHRGLVRAEIDDSKHELLPGMLANFVIGVGDPVTTVAVPLASVVRKGDGTMTVWVTTDRRHFTQRQVTLGLQSNGYDQVLDGLKSGELVATDGAIFLDNMLTPSASD